MTGYKIENNVPVIDWKTLDLEKIAKNHHTQYIDAKPFAHVAIDNLFPNEVLYRILEDIKAEVQQYEVEKNFYGSQKKFGIANPESMPISAKYFVNEMNSANMLKFLEELTGIKGVIGDPYYFGEDIMK